jgi:uncharacterized protein GlcG (DUF336 family)
MTEVPVDVAKTVLDAAEQKAAEIDVPSCLSVVDEGANLVAYRRMDGAWLASEDISMNKAYTARGLDMPTHELADMTQPGQSLWGLNTTNDGDIVVFGGGFPLEADGEVVGAIGSSGGTVDEDMEIAQAGVEAFENR